MDLLDLSY